MTRTVLLTLGRLPKALDLARSFSLAGWRVVVADPSRWHLCRASRSVTRCYQVSAPALGKARYLQDLRAVVERERVDLVVPVSEETMAAAGLASRLPPAVAMFAMPQELLIRLHDKRRFIEHARALGLPVPETHPLGDPRAAELARACDVVVKPVYSCAGRGLRIVERGASLPDPGTEPCIVQAFVPGAVVSTFSIAHGGRTKVTAIYRGAVMSGTVAVCFERVVQLPAVADWVDAFVARTQYSGFISFDFVVDSAGRAQAIECNPRVTSGVHFVRPEDLAHAILDPGGEWPVRFREARLLQQFWPCLTETQKSVFDPARRRHNLRCLLRARDVTWSPRDPLPLLSMPATAWEILAQTIFRGKTFGEAATEDIDWRDDPPAGPAPAEAARDEVPAFRSFDAARDT